MKQAVIYARVSSAEQEQEGFSIPSQVKALRSLAQTYDCNIISEFVESASARKAGREKFNEMIAYVKDYNIETIFCYKPDRLSRNHKDLMDVKELVAERGIELVFFEGGRLDKSPQGMLLLDVLISVASFQVENQALDVKRGMLEKVKSGDWPVEAPLGYKNDKNTRTIVLDDKKAPYVRQLFEMYAAEHMSLRLLSRKAYELGLRSRHGNRIWASGIETILKNPFYYGMMPYKGSLYPGNHTPIITKDLFDKVQTTLKAKKPTQFITKRQFAYRGFLSCAECGCSITAEVQKGHTYYRCTKAKGKCSQRYIREEDLEKEIVLVLTDLEFDAELMDIVIEAVKESEQDNIVEQNKNRKRIENRLAKLKIEQKELVRKNLSGMVPDALYVELSSELEDERKSLERQLAQSNGNPSRTFELVERLLRQANSARQDFVSGTIEEKVEILRNVASNLVLSNREIVSYQLKEPFGMISKWPKNSDFATLWAL